MESEENAAALPSDPTGAATEDDLSYTTSADATASRVGRVPAPLRVLLSKPRAEPSEASVGDLLPEADRVIRRDQLLRAHSNDQMELFLDVSAHCDKVASGDRSVDGLKPIASAACLVAC